MAKADEPHGKVDLNTASRQELLRVPGMSEEGADAILAHRERHGGFKDLDELDQIPGFDQKRIENFRDRLTVA